MSNQTPSIYPAENTIVRCDVSVVTGKSYFCICSYCGRDDQRFGDFSFNCNFVEVQYFYRRFANT